MTNLISVSGRIGSGKDTVGKIIQAYRDFPLASNESILRIMVDGIDTPTAKIKKWADKLKDIVCILINCIREQLEDSDFKNKELGEEWWYWQLERDGEYSTILLPYYESTGTENFKLVKLTPRLLLQLLGTECGRNIIHPNIWVNSLMSEYLMKSHSGPTRDLKFPNWIITDTRFPNELQAVKQRNGLTIRVIRLDVITNSITGKTFPVKVHRKLHESETALDNATFDYNIVNNSTIEELIKRVKEILITEKII